MTLSEKILDYLKRHRRWISGGELERLNFSLIDDEGNKYFPKPSTISRKARQLYNSNERIDKAYKNGFVYYKYI